MNVLLSAFISAGNLNLCNFFKKYHTTQHIQILTLPCPYKYK